MLRAQIGTEKFWTGLRLYYRRFRDANASTDDFRKVMEEVSGQDLSWWFRQWLYRPGSPRLQGSWRHRAGKVELHLAQTQEGVAYRLPLEIGIGTNVVRVEMTQKQQRFEILVDEAPASVTLDPNTWMLIDSTRWEPRARR
jgi:aminopeptidase N